MRHDSSGKRSPTSFWTLVEPSLLGRDVERQFRSYGRIPEVEVSHYTNFHSPYQLEVQAAMPGQHFPILRIDHEAPKTVVLVEDLFRDLNERVPGVRDPDYNHMQFQSYLWDKFLGRFPDWGIWSEVDTSKLKYAGRE